MPSALLADSAVAESDGGGGDAELSPLSLALPLTAALPTFAVTTGAGPLGNMDFAVASTSAKGIICISTAAEGVPSGMVIVAVHGAEALHLDVETTYTRFDIG